MVQSGFVACSLQAITTQSPDHMQANLKSQTFRSFITYMTIQIPEHALATLLADHSDETAISTSVSGDDFWIDDFQHMFSDIAPFRSIYKA